jgi:hypothetical protein
MRTQAPLATLWGNLPVSPDPFPWSASRTGGFAAGVDIEIKL